MHVRSFAPLAAALAVATLAACADGPTQAPRRPAGAPLLAAGGNTTGGGQGATARLDCAAGVYQPGLVAATDNAGGTYVDPQGNSWPGGLYGATGNALPAAVESTRPTVTPVNGVIGIATMGASTMQVVDDTLLPQVRKDPVRAASVRIAGGGQGGRRIDAWADAKCSCWGGFATALKNASIAANQLRVVFVMAMQDAGTSTFEAQVAQNTTWTDQTVANIRAKYPSVQEVFLVPHHYLGYTSPLLEPGVYWNVFTMQRVVDRRAGTTTPWVAIGPYPWANGLGADRVAGGALGRTGPTPREYVCADFTDGTHTSTQGAAKVAEDFLYFLRNDPSASWYRAGG